MKMERLQSRGGYEIPACCQIDREDQVLIICHGFGSSKESPMVQALRDVMPARGFGTYSFDFPSHGESAVSGPALRIQNCVDDLKAVEDHIRKQYPEKALYYFGSSFGAYILLHYLAQYPHHGSKAFLRSAAVNMYGIVQGWLGARPPRWQPSPDHNPMHDYFTLDYGYAREMQITKACLQDLSDFDVFRQYPRKGVSLSLVHGESDETAPLADAMRFAAAAGADIHTVPGADHRLMGPGELEYVLGLAAAFFEEG